MLSTVPKPSMSTGTPSEVFAVFLRLGLTSFGGPIAHIGYFRREFVERRHWLEETQFAQLLAICQMLPGPASSQMGFAIGLFRADWLGAMAAFAGFTLPSALLMFAFAELTPHLDVGIGASVLHGLKLVAVVVVAQGLAGMMRRLTRDLPSVFIAVCAATFTLMLGYAWAQLAVIALGGVFGIVLCRPVAVSNEVTFPVRYGHRAAWAFLSAAVIGLIIASMMPKSSHPTMASVAAAFYQAGALVFGGGRVVLPLLQQRIVDVGWVEPTTFLMGYGAAQAVPGPMFSLVGFLGAKASAGTPVIGACIALCCIFLPGFLLLLTALPLWQHLTRKKWAMDAMAGINASVVGLLAAALYDPLWIQGVLTLEDFAIAFVGFVLLTALRVSPPWVLAWCVAASLLVGAI